MESTDYLHMRTTNMNIRISPLLKSSLIEKAANMGLNLSDYIMHVLTKDMSGQNKELEEVKSGFNKLEKENKSVKLALAKFEALAEPFNGLIGQTVDLQGKPTQVQNAFDVLQLMSQTFQIN